MEQMPDICDQALGWYVSLTISFVEQATGQARIDSWSWPQEEDDGHDWNGGLKLVTKTYGAKRLDRTQAWLAHMIS